MPQEMTLEELQEAQAQQEKAAWDAMLAQPETMLHFKDAGDGYYQMSSHVDPKMYAHLTPCEPQATEVPTPAVAVISPLQMRRALRGANLYDAVEAAVAASIDPNDMDTWLYASEIRSDDPLIAKFGAILGLTDAQIDALFETAKGL